MIIKTDLKQIYCTVVIRAPRKFWMVVIFYVRGQHLFWTEASTSVMVYLLFFLINFHCHKLFHCTSCLTSRCSGVPCERGNLLCSVSKRQQCI